MPVYSPENIDDSIYTDPAHYEMGTFWRGFNMLTYPSVGVRASKRRADYKFYEDLRRGKLRGYELGGLFVDPIVNIKTAWVLGNGVQATAGENEYVNSAIETFLNDNSALISGWLADAYALGDGYIFVAPDGTLQPVNPASVYIQTSAEDFTQVEAYGVKLIIHNPVKLVDELQSKTLDLLEADGKTVEVLEIMDKAERVRSVGILGGAPTITRFPNPTERFNLVHYPHERGSNEVYGHPTVEPLLHLMARYDTALAKALDGVEVMGNPKPVFEGLSSVDATINALATGVDTDRDGNEMPVIEWEDVPALFLEGGHFRFAQPQPFTSETTNLLQILFYLMLQNSSIPEWVWGGAVASSKASVDAQTPAFVRTVQSWQAAFAPRLQTLIETWLAWRGLVDPRMRLRAGERVSVQFNPVIAEDVTALMTRVNNAFDRGVITSTTYLTALDVVQNPQQEVDNAAQERADRDAARLSDIDAEIERMAAETDE